ncbi:hypothetical protein [uncultured Roseobacter sp.]|uniref:GP88 family protein n=1 Tax=uncultured Roseobacter sp. TaxID=114847 RepID=UPI002603201D|nr:hypothetical protein [uncultured Roseobacter sp.]
MTDQLTEEERAAVDAYMADGGQVSVVKNESRFDKIARRRKLVGQLRSDGQTYTQIVDSMRDRGWFITISTVAMDLKQIGMVRETPRDGSGKPSISQVKRARAQEHAKRVFDRRRFKTTPVPFGEPSRMVDASEDGPVFKDRVFQVDGNETVLKDGCNNSKIGGDVLVGRLKGAHIVTLTLPERTTCPSSCKMWRGCYGNSMHYARRWAPGPELERQIESEIKALCASYELVLVRLHILGDFYSVGYVNLWAGLHKEHPGLHVFGFTAWPEDSRIGQAVANLRCEYPDRFMVRVSGRTGTWGSFTLPFPTEAKTIGDAIVCPEQLDGMKGSPDGRHCGNCGICWSTDRPIAFVEH